MVQQGYVQVYTGAGKGKTTAAIGLAIRTIGAGGKVLFLQFMKVADCSEHVALKQFAPKLTVQAWGKPCFIAKKEDLTEDFIDQWGKTCVIFEKGHPPADYLAIIQQGMAVAEEALASGEYDLVVLDELNMAMYFDLVSVDEVKHLLDQRHEKTEVVITGRNCPEAIVEYAHLVTEMKEVKHYYQIGVPARPGIEF